MTIDKIGEIFYNRCTQKYDQDKIGDNILKLTQFFSAEGANPQKQENMMPVEGKMLDEAGDILDIALDVGAEMLRCGAEIHRVEDTITRISRAYGAREVEVFAITSLIVAEIRLADDTYATQTRRIYASRNHLARLEELNSLSREICREPQDRGTVTKRLEEIKKYRPVPSWMCYVGGMLATGAFAMFFGGSWLDGLAAALIGLLMTFVDRHQALAINDMTRTAVSSFFAGALALLCAAVGFGHSADKIIIGTIMIEIPGVACGQSLRELLSGDTLAGSLRLVQALLRACIMALGYLAAIALFSRIGGA